MESDFDRQGILRIVGLSFEEGEGMTMGLETAPEWVFAKWGTTAGAPVLELLPG